MVGGFGGGCGGYLLMKGADYGSIYGSSGDRTQESFPFILVIDVIDYGRQAPGDR